MFCSVVRLRCPRLNLIFRAVHNGWRPVQIRFERWLGSATTLSLRRPSPFCHPERSERICGVPFACPAPTGPQPPPIITESPWKHQPRPCHSRFPEVRGNCRSLHGKPGRAGQVGFAPPDFLLRLVASWAGRSGAHEWRTADPLASLGMTTRRGSLQGKGGCKERIGCKERAVAEPRHLSNLIWKGLHPLRNCSKEPGRSTPRGRRGAVRLASETCAPPL